jgi:hypothetical protein
MPALTDKSLGNRTEMADSDAKRPMMKRWAAWPRSTRWLAGGIAAGVLVLVLVVAWVLFVPAADWLARHDVGSAKGPPLQAARDAARGRLVTFGAGLFAAGALIFTALNFDLLRRNSERADKWQRSTHDLTEQGQVTDRLTKAIEQLGSDNLGVRVGGIYALGRIASDSEKDHPTVMEMLTAFIREHSHERRPQPDPGSKERFRRRDIQAALNVVGHREVKHDIRPIRLARAHLMGADLRGAKFAEAILIRVYLDRAHLRDADLTGANLTGAKLIRADLTHAKLIRADLARAKLIRAKLTGADLTGADLTGADLTGADLAEARWPRDAPVPVGWKLDTSSGRLEAAGTDSGLTEAN